MSETTLTPAEFVFPTIAQLNEKRQALYDAIDDIQRLELDLGRVINNGGDEDGPRFRTRPTYKNLGSLWVFADDIKSSLKVANSDAKDLSDLVHGVYMARLEWAD